MAIAVVSTLLLGVIGGFLSTTRMSARAGDRATAVAALAQLSEDVPGLPYRRCATLAQIRGDVAALGAPAGTTVAVSAIGYLRADGSFAATCTPAADRGAQRLSLVVTAGDAATARGQVVVRDPGARP